MKAVPAVTIAALSGCALAAESHTSSREVRSSSTTRDVGGCPVTVPPQPGLVPPKPYPPEPPFEQVWYGTPELWTTLDPNGAVWSGLPVGKGPHAVGDKTFWWSENFTTAEGENFSGDADITVTAVDLDGSAPTVVEKGGVPSFNRDIKNFMLVGLGFPEPGCWEVTASYRGTELTYVLQIEDSRPGSAQDTDPGGSSIDVADPCSLLSPTQIARAAEIEVSGPREVESMSDPQGRSVPLCLYPTKPFNSITLHLEGSVSENVFRRRLRRDPLNTQEVDGIGDVAFLHAGASISTLVGDHAVGISVQSFTTVEDAEDALIAIAKEAVKEVRART